ncbi:Tpr-related protein family member, putative [Theileria annulata]|uniref:Tpr-related protein family member, putative n=1 Tax=Theileria annulata TaxID=5874 RepID=Q4UHV1_THEAN|nr:Tpr-related protein family member, putative [Theileria annulata]CAI73338.1 Tpr-related protein family member, putative [Theileria annulata]|eukprot:XP_954015.1 Tpr-related protein family member, putative [Theileria annulata]
MEASAEPEHVYTCPSCDNKPAENDRGNCPLLMAAYILAGLAMMLNIRLSYSSAPYALIRFRLPENLFSVFVRRMASSLELWCLPGFIIADTMELAIKLVIGTEFTNWNNLDSKKLKFHWIIIPSIIAQWLNFLTYVILFFVYLAGDDQGHLTTFYWTIAVSGFVFGISNPLVFAADYNYIPIYIAGENCFPALTSFIHYITTLIFGNRRKWDSDFIIVFIDISVAIIISLVAAMVWTLAYGFCRDGGTTTDENGTITYITPDDITAENIKSISVTEGGKTTTYTKVPKGGPTAPDILTLTIKKKGETGGTAAPPAYFKQGEATPTEGPANTITLNYTKDGKEVAILNITITPNTDLQDTADTPECSVKVDTEGKKLTINYGDKCIEITLTTEALKNLGNKCTVKVDPPPNHLFIKYKDANGSVTKKGPINENAKKSPEKIAEEIKKTANDDNKYYQVTDRTTKIRYTFKLTKQLGTAPIAGADAKIIVHYVYGHILAEGFGKITDIKPYVISPLLIVLVGMGLVYAIYPGIAPGMIVPFYLIDKIEMVLLIATIFPPVIIAILRKEAPEWSPQHYVFHKPGDANNGFHGWTTYKSHIQGSSGFGSCDSSEPDVHAWLWHFFDLLMILMIILAYLFIYSLHYRDSNISRSIVNQPKMSTALTIIFYMCHEISLAVGFPGMVSNAAEYTVLAQMIGAFLMVFLALYSEGYIIEYKSHDPADWPTEGMWYLYGYYQLNPDFFIMIKFNVCSDGYCDFK